MARKPLFKRVSAEERRADSQQVLERLLQILDESFDRAESAADILLTLNAPTDIADRYLQLFGDTLNHTWRTDRTYDWNRTRIEEAIERASYKGTTLSIEDLLRDYGAEWWRITDQASRLDIWNRQGGWNSPNGVVMDGNFWHDGAYLLEVDHNLDFDGFIEEFETIRRAGTVWFFRINTEPITGAIGMRASFQTSVEMDSCAKPLSGLYWNWQTHTLWDRESSLDYSGVMGRYLYANSAVPVNAPGLTVSMGTYDNPLVEPWSLMQAPVFITEET